jgi:hypothetical protein
MRTIDCGPGDDDVSYENARDQFRKAREIKKADRETRLLAKADRIRAWLKLLQRDGVTPSVTCVGCQRPRNLPK